MSGWQSGGVGAPEWQTLVALDDGVRTQPAATVAAISACETSLEIELPGDLRGLYLYSDGVWDEPGQWFVIWPLAEVLSRNHTSYDVEVSARREWVGFGDDGTGNPFCIRRDGGSSVHHWSSTQATATLLADDLVSFWAAWVTGTLPPH